MEGNTSVGFTLKSGYLIEVKMYNQNVPLSVRSKGHFLGPGVYAQTAIECTLTQRLSVR